MLKTEQNTPEMREIIIQSALECLGHQVKAYFEHGQWWVMHPDPADDGESECIYSVEDAEGPDTVNGLAFELVS